MEAAEIQNVCRLCPSDDLQNDDSLINVFDNSMEKNMMEVILVTTGIQISKNDLISKKICQRCCYITLNMYKYRQDALKKDQALKEKCEKMLNGLGNSIAKTEQDTVSSLQMPEKLVGACGKLTTNAGYHIKHQLHPSITQLYQTYPNIKLPKTCVNMHMAPVVVIQLHEVRKYLKSSQKKTCENKIKRSVAKKRTGSALNMNKVLTKIARPSYGTNNLPAVVTKKKKKEDIKHCRAAEKVGPVDPFKEHFVQESGNFVSNELVENTAGQSQPVFLKAFGLTPTIPTPYEPLLICNICECIQNSARELEHHKSEHMKCQFCKEEFKFFEDKEMHVKTTCEVMKRLDSPYPKVYLEKINLNMDVRNMYRNVFSDPDPFQEDEVKPPPIQPTSSPCIDDADNIIVLSDDDAECAPANAPIADVPKTPKSVPAFSEETVYTTVSIVRPSISIKNSALFDSIRTSNISDNAFLTEVITLLKPVKSTVDAVLQTDLPSNKDIQINSLADTCEFKNLSSHLLIYKVPIHISNGPFHVCYVFNSDRKNIDSKAQWKTLKVIDARRDFAEASTNCANIHVDNNTLQSNKLSRAAMLPQGSGVTSVSSNANNLINIPLMIMNGINVPSTVVSSSTHTAAPSSFNTFFQNLTPINDIPLPPPPINKSKSVSSPFVRFSLNKNNTPRFNVRYEANPRFYRVNAPFSHYNGIANMPSNMISPIVASNSMTVPANRFIPQNGTVELSETRPTIPNTAVAASQRYLNHSMPIQIRNPPIIPIQPPTSSTNVLQTAPSECVVASQSGASYTGHPVYNSPADRPKFRVKRVSELQ